MAQKVAGRCEFEAALHRAMTGKLCQSSSKWVPFSKSGRMRQQNQKATSYSSCSKDVHKV